MALSRFFFATPILLLSLLVIASAGDYGNSPKPESVKPDYNDVPKPESIDSIKPKPESVKPDYTDIPKPKLENVKSDYSDGPKPKPKPDSVKPDNSDISKPKSDHGNPDYGYSPQQKPYTVKVEYRYDQKLTAPKPDIVNPNYVYIPKPNIPKPDAVKPDYGYDPKPNLDRPKLTIPKPNNAQPNYGYSSKPENPLPVSIEGVVLCKTGSKYAPVKGAAIRIACTAVDQNGYETTPYSCLTGATDAKGYFFKTLPSFGVDDDKVKLKECKAYLEDSPSETCKVPTDVNKGISGALLSSYRILDDKNMKLYSVGPFFYTSEPTSTPVGY